MAECSLCRVEGVIYAPTMASQGRKSMMVVPHPAGTAWFEQGTDHKGRSKRMLVVASREHPMPEGARRFRMHTLDCKPYHAKKRIERLLRTGSPEDD